MNKPYSSIAKFYNRLADHDYDSYYGYVQKYIMGDVVELGAGAGRFTAKYIEKVKSTILVESSTEMLQAISGLRRYRKKIETVNDDMHNFLPFKKVDCVVAVCDVFNYSRNIVKLLDHIDGYVKSGGNIIFDVSTEYKLMNVLGNNIFYEDYDDVTYIWRNNSGIGFVDMDITVFEYVNGNYLRSDEKGRQYAHSVKLIDSTLTILGYSVEAVDGDDYGKLREDSLRALFIAKKQNSDCDL